MVGFFSHMRCNELLRKNDEPKGFQTKHDCIGFPTQEYDPHFLIQHGRERYFVYLFFHKQQFGH
jgi:hypothetical protein